MHHAKILFIYKEAKHDIILKSDIFFGSNYFGIDNLQKEISNLSSNFFLKKKKKLSAKKKVMENNKILLRDCTDTNHKIQNSIKT